MSVWLLWCCSLLFPEMMCFTSSVHCCDVLIGHLFIILAQLLRGKTLNQPQFCWRLCAFSHGGYFFPCWLTWRSVWQRVSTLNADWLPHDWLMGMSVSGTKAIKFWSDLTCVWWPNWSAKIKAAHTSMTDNVACIMWPPYKAVWTTILILKLDICVFVYLC